MGRDVTEALARLRAAAADGSLDALCERHLVRVLGVFGSALHSAEAEDLDVGVGFLTSGRGGETPHHGQGRAAVGDLLGLLDDLIQLTAYDRLDVAVIDGASPVLRARALSGEGLYEHAAGGFATEQMAALAEERDTAWLRRLSLEAMAR